MALASLLTVADVAQILRVSRRSVYRLAETGALQALQLDGLRSTRFTEQALEDYLRRGENHR